MVLAEELLAAGRDVRVLDLLLHGQEDRAAELRDRGVELIRGDIRDAEARREALAAPTPSCTSPRSSATRPARATRSSRTRSTSTPRWRWSPTPRASALRVRLDLLELRPHGRPDGADHRGGRARARCRSTPSRRSASSRRCSARRRRRPLAPTCLRFATVYGVGPAHALRPHGQRVHPRPLGRPPARGLRRAVLAPLRPRPRRRPGRAHRARGAGREGRRRGVQRRALGRELPQARPRRGDPPADRHAARSPTSRATRTRATTRSRFDKIARACSASRPR